MQIVDCFGTTVEQIKDGRWNPFLGISIQNRSFTDEYLQSFIDWAPGVCRQRCAIMIVDWPQRINNTVLDHHSSAKAADRRALEKGASIRRRVDLLLEQAPAQTQAVFDVFHWRDIIVDPTYRHNEAVIAQAFASDAVFRGQLTSVARSSLGSIVDRLDDHDLTQLAQYVVEELPPMLCGVTYRNTHFDLNVYPGAIWRISQDLAGGTWAGIESQLTGIGPVAAVEAY